MSSTIAGSGGDDGDREDELELEYADEAHLGTPNGHAREEEQEDNAAGLDQDEPLDDAPSSISSSRFQGPGESTPKGAESPLRASADQQRGVDSIDDTGSIPDDTPSIHDSVLSSRSSVRGLRGSPSNLSPSPHRPFERRFQSRLSASFPSPRRSISPSLNLQQHSRNSSVTSQLFASSTPDLQESPLTPWEVVRWTKLRKITGQAFSEAGKRNFGRPTCMAVSTTIVIGTGKGVILVFDYQQNLKTIIGPGTKASEAGPVTALAISADHTTLAGGHADGSIFTWEIARASRPFLHIPPVSTTQTEAKPADGHRSGVKVIHVGFLGTRRTALVSANDHGMAFSHLATRGTGAIGRTVKTTRILGRYPDVVPPPDGRTRKPSSVLAFSPLPLGNVEASTDSLGLVAMLTPYLLVIVSTTPVAQTQYKAGRPKEVAAHSALTAALAWFPAIKLKAKNAEASKTKLVYCWSNVLTVLEVSEVRPTDAADRDKPPSFEFKPRSRWRADEAIVAVQWISRSVLAVMTITQQLLILEDGSLRVTDSFDLIHKHIYHVDLFSKQLYKLVEQLDEEDQSMHGVIADAFYMSFRTYKGRLFLLGVNDMAVGSLSNWADRLWALMEGGDFIGAVRLATSYYIGDTEKLTVGLPEEDGLRKELVQEKLLEMMSASLKYAFGRNQEAENERLEAGQLTDLADACIHACDAMSDHDFLFDEVYMWYEEGDSEGVFLDVLEPYIVDGNIRTLSPPAVKSLITHYSTNHTLSRLEEIICLLDTTTLDIDRVTFLCKQHNLYDAFIYVWTRSLGDYVGPLIELIDLVNKHSASGVNGNANTMIQNHTNATKMFPYLSYTLTGRIYPTGDEIPVPDDSVAKAEIYNFLFSGKSRNNEPIKNDSADSFAGLKTMLLFDAASFMSMLNEAFEDSFLNETADQMTNGALKPVTGDGTTHGVSVNRQYIISLLLEVMESPDFGPGDTIYLDMFIARNLPKYPQYILLSGSTIQQVLVRLCQCENADMLDDCQLSVEYLLSIYHPPDIYALIPLFKEARFFRILKSIYKSEKLFSELLLTYFEDPEDRLSVFACIRDCLRSTSGSTKKQRREIHNVVKENAALLAEIDIVLSAQTVQAMLPDLHQTFLDTLQDDPSQQFRYLNALLEPEQRQATDASLATKLDRQLIERYVQLLCRYNPSHVADFVDVLKVGDLQLEEVLPSMESSGIIDAAVILLARQGEVRRAMDRLTKHLSTLEAGLSGILQNSEESPDSASTAEAVADLMDSLAKYSRVGSWICQEQTKAAAAKSRAGNKLAKRGAAALKQPLSFEEELWLDLIGVVVRIARNISPLLKKDTSIHHHEQTEYPSTTTGADTGELSHFFRSLVQQVFTALLTSTSQSGDMSGENANVSFLRVLRAFLTRAAAVSPSLSELRSVIASIFSTYTYEESILSLANAILDKDLFIHVNEIAKLRQRGWRPRRQVCEVCRLRVWGPGSGAQLWEAWETKQVDDAKRGDKRRLETAADAEAASRAKGKAPVSGHSRHQSDVKPPRDYGDSAPGEGPLIVFACRHTYHRSCLVKETATRVENGGVSTSHLEDDAGLEFGCLYCTQGS